MRGRIKNRARYICSNILRLSKYLLRKFEYEIAPRKLKTADLLTTYSMRISTAFKGYRDVASSFGAESPAVTPFPCLFVSPIFIHFHSRREMRRLTK